MKKLIAYAPVHIGAANTQKIWSVAVVAPISEVEDAVWLRRADNPSHGEGIGDVGLYEVELRWVDTIVQHRLEPAGYDVHLPGPLD